jgi:hypothetical protein
VGVDGVGVVPWRGETSEVVIGGRGYCLLLTVWDDLEIHV